MEKPDSGRVNMYSTVLWHALVASNSTSYGFMTMMTVILHSLRKSLGVEI
jgi:hypothetical protein